MDKYKLYLQDLVFLLKENFEQAKVNQSASKGEFNKGVSTGIYQCLDLVKQQAVSFGIPLSELGIDDFTLEDLL